MTSHARQTRVSVEAYLEGEKRARVKHEYVAGRVFAMVGVSLAHNRITLNIASALRTHLAGGPCEVYIADVKVRVEAADAFYYPDAVVTCRPAEEDPYYLRHPCLVVEVLSPATEAIDRREKWLAYQRLESLQEYVLVAQVHREVVVHRRDPDGEWSVDTYTGAERLRLESVDGELDLDTVYERVDVAPAPPAD